MHSRQSAHDRVISHLHVAGQCAVIGENDVISDSAVVPDVTVRQEISAIANPRSALACRATINGYELAERVFVADFQISRFATIFQVLGLLADGAVRVEFVFRAGVRGSAKCHMMLQPAILTEHDVGAYYAIRPDDRSRADFGSRIDNGGWMNLHVAHLSRNVNISSPSETTASLTTQ